MEEQGQTETESESEKGKVNVAGLLTGGPRGSYDRLIHPQPPPTPLPQLEMWVSLKG